MSQNWFCESVPESRAVFKYLLHLLQNQPCFTWTRRCAVIPVLHRSLSPLHHCMDIHLLSVSALAKDPHKKFPLSLWWKASEFDDNAEIIAPLSVWIQHKQKGLPAQFFWRGSSCLKCVLPLILKHQETLLFTLQEWQFWFSVFLSMCSFFCISNYNN